MRTVETNICYRYRKSWRMNPSDNPVVSVLVSDYLEMSKRKLVIWCEDKHGNQWSYDVPHGDVLVGNERLIE